MTVKRLRKILKGFDKTATVLVDGKEFGVCDLDEDGVESRRYSRDVNKWEEAGPHEVNENGSYIGVLLTRGW